jgi:hypothetical protein
MVKELRRRGRRDQRARATVRGAYRGRRHGSRGSS